MRNLPISPKVIDEVVMFFNQPNSFYFAHNFDLTRTLQSHSDFSSINGSNNDNAEMANPDQRFFWNRDMLKGNSRE
jgi:hypothetical protein